MNCSIKNSNIVKCIRCVGRTKGNRTKSLRTASFFTQLGISISCGTIFKAAIYSKEGNYKIIPSSFLTCIRLKPELNISASYVAAYLRHKENSIISKGKTINKSSEKKSKIQLKLSDIYNIESPIASIKIQKEIDKLSSEATSLLKQSIEKTKRIENIIKKNS
ncbi:MAG: hypothetical protein LBD46_02080 [Endomicrobium sp.]|nr:hypothetical protein [Endomicrobium sp.]